jgi:hypothetical protein
MSDPQDIPRRKPRPTRAEPIQPDAPTRGAGQVNDASEAPAGSTAAVDTKDTANKQKKQSKAALDNVRDGYK